MGPHPRPLPVVTGPQAAGKRVRVERRARRSGPVPCRCLQRLECRLSSPPIVQVQGTVDGNLCQLVVDTGVERTFVRANVVRARHIPRAEQQLCGVTGHCVMLRGPVTMEIVIGEVVEQPPVYVADMEELCLLGVDFLVHCGASVDVGRGKLRLHNVEAPLLLIDAARSSGRSREAARESLEQSPGLGCYVARGERMDGTEERQLPTHVWDLAARSTTQLNPMQKQALEQLLSKYADLFSHGDHDLGHTALVKHTINTAGHAPIKQPPRRVAPAKREKMQRLVEEMAAQGVIECSDSPW
ncbi:hypothetical protein E2C01_082691 [Portunus trituberculatus]|uniref:Peptidase A2 domain-containing protein n=1 Tax=Portunus trituberculatus TaxID=210409 RepID=A0A5B7IZ47_PORTR|nr:hypothetical protein [Portunus trituberculatus]